MKRYPDYKRRDAVCSIQIGPLTSPCQAHMACFVHILLLAGSLRKPTRISLTCYHCHFHRIIVTTDQPTFYRDGNKGWWHDWCIHVNTRILWWTKNNFYLAIVNQTPFQFLTIWHIGGERDPSSRLHVWSPCSSWHWLPTWIKSDLPRVLISSRIMRSRNFWTGTFPIE